MFVRKERSIKTGPRLYRRLPTGSRFVSARSLDRWPHVMPMGLSRRRSPAATPTAEVAACACPDFCERDHENE